MSNRLKEDAVEDHLTESYLREIGYWEVVSAFYQVIVKRPHKKVNCVWITGPPNTGKTTLSEMLEEIFICDVLQEGASHFHINAKQLE